MSPSRKAAASREALSACSRQRSRQDRLKSALFLGESLTLANPDYARFVRTLTEELLRADREPEDLTSVALRPPKGAARARIIAKEPGVLAGLDEAVWYFARYGVSTIRMGADGQPLQPGAAFLELRGDAELLLSLERVGLNLLQRMCGIATATRRLQAAVKERHSGMPPTANVVVTRKTPWGLMDKRAAHLGGGGTHRLGLHDAILIKTNHLKLFAPNEEDAIPLALNRAWSERHRAKFIEVEVNGLPGALAAGRAFRSLQAGPPASDSYPCLIMLDNRSVEEVFLITAGLRSEGLLDSVLIEVSGGVSAEQLGAYANTGVDAISVGALTHSCRALDLSCKLEREAGRGKSE
jgi:nicotinate-nucleotide pyrophosphorylase (carboxylating)